MDQTVICIAGAHRSGTSLLTRLLQQCGLYLGHESEMMPPAEDNPDGFWENLRFVDLNDEVLSAVGAAWDLPPRDGESFKGDRFASGRAKAELLIESFLPRPCWGWKDPRNSLTLPFWQNLLPAMKTIVMVRNPLEVAYSMHKRNGTSYALGLRLWEIYNRRVMATTRSDRRLITSYQAFFDEPKRELKTIADFAGLSNSDTATAASLVLQSRRHTSFSIEQTFDAGVSEELIRFFQELVSGRAKGDNSSRSSQLDQLSGTPSRINRSVPDSEDIRKELATRRGNELSHREALTLHQETIESLRKEIGANNVRAAAELGRRDGRIEELQKAYARLDEMLLAEQQRREELNTRLLSEQERRERVTKELNTQLSGEQQQHENTTRELNKRLLGEQEERERVTKQLNTRLLSEQEERGRVTEELSNVRDRFNQTNQLLQSVSLSLSAAETRNVSLTDRLRKQLLELKKLLQILEQTSKAATLLRQSRRWKMVNPFGTLRSLFTSQPLEGFGHLDNNMTKYQAWRQSHPEVESLSTEILALRTYQSFTPAAGPVPSAETKTSKLPVVAKPPVPTEPIAFVRHEEAEVSIIIPVFNQIDYTLSCLAAVQRHSGLVSYEVIVIDDGSNDATTEALPQIPGLSYLRSDQNAGFIASCNRGAAAARGKYLVFLNNDTNVTDGWLTALRETFDYDAQAGLVGSKLVYPDGRLQEAGGIIWRDGSGWNRGKFQDPLKPEYNYLRAMDYCSAASVMIPADLFNDLGGFDLKYAPAYYEDTDLAFKVREKGRRVLYQPTSVVIHYEGITGGTDTSTGAKKHQITNRETFTQSWANVLCHKPENGDTESYEALESREKRILVIDHHLPLIDRDSGSLRMSQILTILHRLGHRVTFIPDNLADIPPYGDALRQRGIEVVHHPYLKSVDSYLEENGARFDFVILSRRDFARKHIKSVRRHAPQAALIFDTVDLHFLREEREVDVTRDPELQLQLEEKRRQEFELIDAADATWVVSPAEREFLQQERPDAEIEVISNIVDVTPCPAPFALRRDILFIGSFQHGPNIDAVLYFAREILPTVAARLPEMKFYIIGDKAPPEVVALASETVIVTGYQPDVACFFEGIKLSVAPLRYGAGVKGKVNQSMGFGVPVVATSIAAEGMSLTHGNNVLMADRPVDFADALVELYNSEALWTKISRNGLAQTRALFSADAAHVTLARIFSEQPELAHDTSGANYVAVTSSFSAGPAS